MKIVFPLYILLSLSSSSISGQSYFKFSGTIQDSATGDFLPYAQILDTLSGRHVEADQFGRYSMTLKESTHHFTIYNVGYQSKTIEVNANHDIHQIILLGNITLPELVIQGTPSMKIENGYVDMSLEKIKSIPTLLGEKDVLKALAILPGVAP